MNATETAVDILAVARLTHLIQEDTVPPVYEAREWVMERYSDRRWASLIDCPWCLSPYLGVLVAVARWKFPRAWPIAARVLAGSQVTGQLAQIG